MYNTLTCR